MTRSSASPSLPLRSRAYPGQARTRPILLFLALSSVLTACREHSSPSPIRVFAAASLREVITDLVPAAEARGFGPIETSFAGSNVLAQQILAVPAAADLFLSADRVWMETLVDQGRVDPEDLVPFAGNSLVLVGLDTSSAEITGGSCPPESLSFRYLALGDPRGVPAGRYARQALEYAGVWPQVSDRVVPTADVRAALALAESSPEVLAVVYSSDLSASSRISRICQLENLPEEPIAYWGASMGEDSRGAAILQLLLSKKGQALLTARGFLPAPRRG